MELYKNYYTTHIRKYELCPAEESRSIMASSWKEINTRPFYKSWLSPSRGDSFLFDPPPRPKNPRPVLDLTVPLGVQFLIE